VRPPRGTIALGEDVWLDSARNVFRQPDGRRVGLVFQEYALFPHMTVRQNVAYAGKERVDEYLERFRISHLGDVRPNALSGGERQRVALARALARGPGVRLELQADNGDAQAVLDNGSFWVYDPSSRTVASTANRGASRNARTGSGSFTRSR